MSIETQNDTWEVEVGGQIYAAPFSELQEWIDEGSLQPIDLVRRGNLRWIEAQRVPALIPFFNAKARGERIVPVTTINEAPPEPLPEQPSEPPIARQEALVQPEAPTIQTTALNQMATAAPLPVAPQRGSCRKHPDREAAFNCTQCRANFCKACPPSYGASVRLCPDCGSLCRSVGQTAEIPEIDPVQLAILNEPFGFRDLVRAFGHPFRYKASLAIGGVMFTVFTVGQSAASVGGIFLMAAAIMCAMLANMMWFGVLANTIDNFVHGRFDSDFLPSFDEFSLWDDVVHPFFLSIAAYISSFGPLLVVGLLSFYLIASAATEEMNKFNSELTKVPGTPLYAPDRAEEQSREVREILERIQASNEKRRDEMRGRAERQAALAEQESPPLTGPEQFYVPEGLEGGDLGTFSPEQARDRLGERIQAGGPGSIAETEKSLGLAAGRIFKLAAPLVVIAIVALLWGLFYFPAACAVAGYSRSFMSTINPAVGLDTIRRLGRSYALILLMGLLILCASAIFSMMLRIVLFPFEMPGIGNMPASAIGSIGTFYCSVVFSCILGYALSKNARRLGLRN